MPRRLLSRRSKNLCCMRQFGFCGYCGEALTDAFHVDHKDEDCTNDHKSNLCACCGTCHANKTMHYRKGRTGELASMLLSHDGRQAVWDEQWGEDDDHWSRLPRWLRRRLTRYDTRMHFLQSRPEQPVVDWEQYRYRGI